MYKLNIMPAATQDQDSALEYIAETLQNPTAAVSLLDEIDKCYDTLEENPFLYGFCQDPQLRALGCRRAIIKKYILIFKVDETMQIVHILRFVYGPSDYARLI